MIKVDEEDPIGELELSFPYRDVKIRRGVNPKDHYELDAEIGRGKFGTVYKCTEKSTGLSLAAKFIGVPKKEDRRNVEREIDIMRQLQHPRLIQLYDAFENGKVMCVVQELIEGGELFERVIDDDFILTEKSCTVFIRQICEGIEFIHKQNILHLDMKPENILCLTKTGNRIKIIDFGLARKFDPTKKLQVLFGTPEFVAPEVVNFDQIGFGTDMWSIGVICYVLLSGLSPFMGHTDIETMANVTIAKYDFDDEAFQEISDNAKDFIRKLLLKDMNARMTSTECLKHAWLQRRVKKLQTNQMDTTKDNLKQFVERWSDHPNSPYLFEVSSHSILPCMSSSLKLSESLNSLVVSNPSPPESLSSSLGSDDNFFVFNSRDSFQKDFQYPAPDHFRRASDSYGVVKSPDIVERLNLAEEIRKLSDKLFQLSTISPNLNCTIQANSNSNSNVYSNSAFKLNSTHSEKVETTVPWRKQHNKINQSSRDVPISPRKKSSDTFREQFNSRLNLFNSNSSTSDNPVNTKDVLLKLLDRWEGPKVQKIRHSSISTEYSESESLVGQKTINSLNTFFQTRRTTSNK